MSRNSSGVIKEGFLDQSNITFFPSQEAFSTCELFSGGAPASQVMQDDNNVDDDDLMMSSSMDQLYELEEGLFWGGV